MKVVRPVIFLVLVSAMAFAQARPEFEVASIKPSPEQTLGQAAVGLHIDGSQVRGVYLPLRSYIVVAYKLKDYQVIGPDWLAQSRFDISAKLPDGATADQVPEMLKTLLADKFKLVLHHDTKEFPVYTVTVEKGGAKLRPSADDGVSSSEKGTVNVAASGSAAGVGINMGNGSYYSLADNRFEGKKLTMTTLVNGLSRFLDRPVVDQTELQGNYDVSLDLSLEDYRAMLVQSAINAGVSLPPQALRALDVAPGDSLAAALEKVGLKFQPGKAPLDIVIVDSVLKVPAGR